MDFRSQSQLPSGSPYLPSAMMMTPTSTSTSTSTSASTTPPLSTAAEDSPMVRFLRAKLQDKDCQSQHSTQSAPSHHLLSHRATAAAMMMMPTEAGFQPSTPEFIPAQHSTANEHLHHSMSNLITSNRSFWNEDDERHAFGGSNCTVNGMNHTYHGMPTDGRLVQSRYIHSGADNNDDDDDDVMPVASFDLDCIDMAPTEMPIHPVVTNDDGECSIDPYDPLDWKMPACQTMEQTNMISQSTAFTSHIVNEALSVHYCNNSDDSVTLDDESNSSLTIASERLTNCMGKTAQTRQMLCQFHAM